MRKLRVLVVDDEAHQRKILEEFLTGQGFATSSASQGQEALEMIKSAEPAFELVFTDLAMPGMDGIELIKRAKALPTDADFFVVTAHGTIETAIKAVKGGAYDYLLKPLEFDEVTHRIEKLLEIRKLQDQTRFLTEENKALRGAGDPVAESKIMKSLLNELEQASKTTATVLLIGETGVGKEVLARFVHEKSSRSRQPFVAVNCAAIPENLLESEFFGHEKGAFTGAQGRSVGLFERADGGTLFLDEIGEMDIKLQPKLLRAIEERKIRRVGGTSDFPIDVRLIAATNQDLKKRVSEGRFREDLYYRLNVVPFKIPPLREHKEDIPALVTQMIRNHSKTMGVRVNEIDPSYLAALSKHDFPGNVRELTNIVERSLIFLKNRCLTAESLGAVSERDNPGTSAHAARGIAIEGNNLGEIIDSYEKTVIQEFLDRFENDVEKTAHSLGVSRSTLYSKISKLGIKVATK